jgi:hypothetical protein
MAQNAGKNCYDRVINPPRQYFPKMTNARSRGNTLISDPKAIS